MERGKQDAGRCRHGPPVVVERTPDGRVARCLACGGLGPARPSPERALAALRGEARPLREAG